MRLSWGGGSARPADPPPPPGAPEEACAIARVHKRTKRRRKTGSLAA